MACPAPVAPEPGLEAVGTPRIGRGVEIMENTMTKKTRPLKKTESRRTAKARTVASHGRRSPKTKKQIAIALLERPKGASLAEMQRAMGWQAHSVRAALTGLRKRGLGITRETNNAGTTMYRIMPQHEGSPS
jgi:predicted DNA-binding transcriptional regulator